MLKRSKHELDDMLAERERLNQDIQQLLDAQTDAWGIKVSNVEGELQASEKLLAAAEILAVRPQAMQLRYLQTLSNMPATGPTPSSSQCRAN